MSNKPSSDQEAAFKQNVHVYLEQARISAEHILPKLFTLIKPKSVVDFGCGGGAWLSMCRTLGVEDVIGIDGSYVDVSNLMFPKECFRAHDLRYPLNINQKFDLAISLEVAEHIPQESAAIFIDNLIKLSPVILFSAAIPFQGGVGHVNEQWPSYWRALFQQRGYQPIDCIRKNVWDCEQVNTWYKQNVILYVETSFLSGHAKLSAEYECCKFLPIDQVHPYRYLAEADPKNIDARKVPLHTAWAALRFQLRRKLYTKLHWGAIQTDVKCGHVGR